MNTANQINQRMHDDRRHGKFKDSQANIEARSKRGNKAGINSMKKAVEQREAFKSITGLN
jgi:hypothetical protein